MHQADFPPSTVTVQRAASAPPATVAMAEPPAAPATPLFHWQRWTLRAVLIIVVADVLLAAAVAGLRLRQWGWETTETIRFTGDIQNGINWADQALKTGLVELYDQVERDAEREYQAQIRNPSRPRHPRDRRTSRATVDDGPQYGLDYGPLRLLTMMKWAQWLRSPGRPLVFRTTSQFVNEWEFVRPLLTFNTIMQAAAAAGVLVLVLVWMKRGGVTQPWRQWLAAVAAAVFFWLNAAMILDSHCWPQWDSWLLPFFVWALVLASLNWWLTAGFLVAVGAMFKGQILLAAPIFVLWPLFAGRPLGPLRWTVGFALGLAVVGSPWLMANGNARLHAGTTVLAGGVLLGLAVFRRRQVTTPPTGLRPRLVWLLKKEWIDLVGLTAAFALAVWPLARPGQLATPLGGWQLAQAWGLVAAWVVSARFLPLRALKHWAIAAVTASLCLSPWLFGTSTSWFKIGIGYGARHYGVMAMGASNLPAVLAEWGWQISPPAGWPSSMPDGSPPPVDPNSTVSFEEWAGWLPTSASTWLHENIADKLQIGTKPMFIGLYAITLVICGIAAGVHDRRNDRRFLAACVAPWVLCFAFMGQMHERYLMWGAAVSACLVMYGVGGMLLHLLITALSFVIILRSMPGLEDEGRWWFYLVAPMRPGVGWATVAVAMVCLFYAMAPTRPWQWFARRRPAGESCAAQPALAP